MKSILAHKNQYPKLRVSTNLFHCLARTKEFNIMPSQQPKTFDVICGRDTTVFKHTGNKICRKFLKIYLKQYANASTKKQKLFIVSEVIGKIRSYGGDFVEYDNSAGTFQKVSEKMAFKTVGRGFHYIYQSQYRSSIENQKRQHVIQRQHEDETILQIMNSNKRVNTIMNCVSEKIQSNEDTISDENFERIFMLANMNILKELKESQCDKTFLQACNE